jgi:hypothetical protein
VRIIAQNYRIIGEPYKFKETHNSLIVNTKETENIIKVISSHSSYVHLDEILVYNKEKAIECIINGKTYIAIKYDDIIARIDLEEGEENNG